jgi:hypothetical protein
MIYGVYKGEKCMATSDQSPSLELPLPLSQVPDLVGLTRYSAPGPGVTYDVSYDIWLGPSAQPVCPGQPGALEVMVWLDYSGDRALLPVRPRPVAVLGYSVNGAVMTGSGVWRMYSTGVNHGGTTTIDLVLDKPEATPGDEVGVELSQALHVAGQLLKKYYNFDDSSYWLNTIDFGLEFGPAAGSDAAAGSAYFSSKIGSYCLHVGVILATATCLTQ